MATREREITAPVDLCGPDGRLSPEATGWSRTPVHRTRIPGWGRTKRWEYWCLTSPTHLVAVTVSDLDFLSLTSVYVLEYGPGGREFERSALTAGSRGVQLPDTVAGRPGAPPVVVGPKWPGKGKVRAEILPEDGGTRLRSRCVSPDGLPVELDALVSLPEGHESLSVVVPWSERRFQYTSKQPGLPVTGRLRIGGEVLRFGAGSWATLDHGRGRWPRSIRWNWGSASGVVQQHTVGLQFGGRWTEGTGATENGLLVDGRLTKLGDELDWTWSRHDYLAPWTVRDTADDRVDLVFTPFHRRRSHVDTGLVANRTDQCFGHWSGHIRPDDGARITVDGLLGWAEDVRMRW